MTDGASSRKDNKLDLAELRRIVNLMETKNLAEVELEQQGKRVRVVRAVVGMTAAGAVAIPAVPGPAPAVEAVPEKPEKRGVEVPSPMVGTFYRAPSPDAAPYVEVGDRINAESVVCIIEAMKVMNEIKAESDGEILEILVQNGEPVEFGQPLFLLRPSGSGAA